MTSIEPILFSTTRYETDGPSLYDIRVFFVCQYALECLEYDFPGQARRTNDAVYHVHDHKGDLYVAYTKPLSLMEETAFIKAWREVGGEQTVHFVKMNSMTWHLIWSLRRDQDKPHTKYEKMQRV